MKLAIRNLKTPKALIVLSLVIALMVVATLVVYALSVSDTFDDETQTAYGTGKIEITGGQAKLASCYTPDPSWTLTYDDTVVRDISSLSSKATVTKDIYCDDTNCILWPYNAAAPTTVCIATDSYVYGNILWSKTDYCTGAQPCSTGVTWSDTNFSLSGGDIGGTHTASLLVGDNESNVGNKKWLERYYTTASGTFNAMDACKAKGSGWRLPTILELDSIRDQAKGSSPYTRLPNIVANNYWSSSESSSTNAYRLNFIDGNVSNKYKSGSNAVRCVRGQ